MKNNILNKVISVLFILNVVLFPFSTFFAEKAKAQSVNGMLSGLAPAIAQLPLCQQWAGSKIKSLFNSKAGAAAKETAKVGGKKAAEKTLGDQASTLIQPSVTVDLSFGDKMTLGFIEGSSKQTKANTEALMANDTCLKSIGRLIIKLMLQKVTLATIDWINNGFEGGPAFIENPGEFFHNIAKTELLNFGMEISNPQLFPFGKAWMQRQARAFQARFADNARYSLNELIRQTTPYTAQEFYVDFSAGGWDAWNFMTQIPANNPLGFQQMASTEWNMRIAGTVESPANEVRNALQQAGGFLGQQVCVDPQGLSREEHNKNLATGNPYIGRKNPYNPETQKDFYEVQMETDKELAENWNKAHPTCQRWEYKTPGRMIADRATNVVNYQDNLLLRAEDLNDAMAAIIDALLNRFATDLMNPNTGFSGMNYPSGGGFYIDNSIGDTRFTTQTSEDFPSYLISSSSWLQENIDFNIRTDLTQAVIDEQRIYRDKLVEQNEVLADLNKVIFQVDYCIPGPNPDYINQARAVLDTHINSIEPKTLEDMKNLTSDAIGKATPLAAAAAGATVGAIVGTAVPVVGNLVGAAVGFGIGFAVGSIGKAFDNAHTENNKAERLNIYYTMQVAKLTKLKFGDSGKWIGASVTSPQQVSNIVNSILNRYIEKINKYYNSSKLPPTHKEAAQQYQKALGYNRMINENEEAIVEIDSIIKRLSDIKSKIDALNSRQLEPTEYEEELKPIIGEFGRLSALMFTGDDIAREQNTTNQAEDEIRYVYTELLVGPYGCENNLAGKLDNWSLENMKRPTYPMPILYDYNNYTHGQNLPYPGGSYKNDAENINLTRLFKYLGNDYKPKQVNKMHGNYDNTGIQGFLGRNVIYDNDAVSCAEYVTNSKMNWVIDCIEVVDLFTQVKPEKKEAVQKEDVYVDQLEQVLFIY
jgi:hypothetical protein